VDGVFLFEYDIVGEGWSFRTRQPGGGESAVELLGAGALTRAFVADQYFRVRLVQVAEASCLVACAEYSFGGVGFRWAIVPEPSTFALLAGGILALALTRRGRPSCAAS
jgi:hypothetical protein